MDQDNILNKKYKVEQMLGKGSFAEVYKAINIQTNEAVALKKVSKKLLQKAEKAVELMNQEIKILKSNNSENTIQFIEQFSTDEDEYIVIDYCNGGTLQALLDVQKRFSEDQTFEYFIQILSAFKQLHKQNIVHRDIKLDNIMIHNQADGRQIIKIIDFGVSKMLVELAITHTGTQQNMAPEIMEGKEYGLEVDVYSVGVILYQMLFGQKPYLSTGKQLLQEIKSGNIDFNKYGVQISNDMKDLISKMLTYSQNDRIKWDAVYTHPIINQMIQSHKTKDQNAYQQLEVSRKQAVEFYQTTYVKKGQNPNLVKLINNNLQIEDIFKNVFNPKKSTQDLKLDDIMSEFKQSQVGIESALKKYNKYIDNYRQVLLNLKLMGELDQSVRDKYLIYIQSKLGYILINNLILSFKDDINFLNIEYYDQFKQTESYKRIGEQAKEHYILFLRTYNVAIKEIKMEQLALQKQNSMLFLNINNEIEEVDELSSNFQNNYLSILQNHRSQVAQHIKILFDKSKKVDFDVKLYFISYIFAYDFYNYDANFNSPDYNSNMKYNKLKNDSLEELLTQFKEIQKTLKKISELTN